MHYNWTKMKQAHCDQMKNLILGIIMQGLKEVIYIIWL